MKVFGWKYKSQPLRDIYFDSGQENGLKTFKSISSVEKDVINYADEDSQAIEIYEISYKKVKTVKTRTTLTELKD